MIAALPEWSSWLIWPAVMLVAMCFDALFSGLETGVYVMNKLRLELHVEAGHRPARRLQRMLADTRNLLSVLLIGVNVARYADTFCITALFILAGYGRQAEWLSLAVATPTLFVFTESVPKAVFHRSGAPAVYRCSGLLRVSDIAFKITGVSYLVRGVSWLTMTLFGRRRAQGGLLAPPGLAAVVAEGRASGALTQFQSIMADRIANISEVTLADVMVPMSRVMRAPAGVTRDELRRLIREHNYSRVPVMDERGGVVGVLDVYEALIDEGDAPPEEHTTLPLVLPSAMVVTEALWRMQRTRTPLAVVARNERPVGIVTVKDLVEEIVGELRAW